MRLGYIRKQVAKANLGPGFNEAEAHAPRIPGYRVCMRRIEGKLQ